jgi:hypothetical protein
MNPKILKSTAIGVVATVISAETIALAHHELNNPKQEHPEHEYYFALDKPPYNLTTSGGITTTPGTGSMGFGR